MKTILEGLQIQGSHCSLFADRWLKPTVPPAYSLKSRTQTLYLKKPTRFVFIFLTAHGRLYCVAWEVASMFPSAPSLAVLQQRVPWYVGTQSPLKSVHGALPGQGIDVGYVSSERSLWFTLNPHLITGSEMCPPPPSPVELVMAVMYFAVCFLSKASNICTHVQLNKICSLGVVPMICVHITHGVFLQCGCLGATTAFGSGNTTFSLHCCFSKSFVWLCYVFSWTFYLCRMACCYLKSPFK